MRAVDALVRRALDLVIAGAVSAVTAPVVALLALAIRLESPGHPIYPRRASARTARCLRSTSCARWSTAPSSPARASRSRRATTGSPGSAAFLRRYSLDELPNLWNVLRGEMSIVGPRPTLQVQVDQYTERQRGRLAVKPGITGWAQVNGRASLPWSERIELDLWYVEHRTLALDLEILARTVRMVVTGQGLYKGETGGWRSDVGVLLTGVGKRYDIVSAFAQHATVVAADPNPLAPAQYAAHYRRAVPRIDDPEYVPALRALCEEFDVGAVVPLTDLDIEVLAHARAAGELPAFVPDPEIARATFDKYEAHLLLEQLGLPSPPTVLPGEPVAVLPGDGQAAPGLGRPLDPPRRRRAPRTAFFVRVHRRAGDGPEADGRAGVLDRRACPISTAAA